MHTQRINLQLFAEPTPEQNNLTAKELKAQLTAANAQIAKLTNKADALASENAAKTKQLRERMTAEELEKTKETERNEQFKAMEQELTALKIVSVCMDALEMSQTTAEQYAAAKVSGDTATETKILKQHIQGIKSKMMQEFLAERGEISAGHGDSHESKAVQLIKSLPTYSTEVDENILKAYM